MPKSACCPEPRNGWLHPQSRLEFHSQEAFEGGCDPIPHWRNAEIKRIHRHCDESTRAARIDLLFRFYDRDGYQLEERESEPPGVAQALLGRFGIPVPFGSAG